MRTMAKSFDALLRDGGFGRETTGDSIVMGLQENLRKALSNAGYPTGTADMTALRLENLDATMTSVLFSMQHLKIFNSIPRVPSIQPLFEYNVRLAYGGGRGAPGFAEGGAPVGGTSSWERRNTTVRYMGVRGGITHQALTTGLLGGAQINPVEEEHQNRTLELLERIERQTLYGRTDVLDENGQTVNYDGFFKQMGALDNGSGTIAPNNVIDMKGAPMSFDVFEKIAERLYSGAFVPSVDGYLCFMTPSIMSDLSALRVGIGTSGGNTYAPSIQRHVLDSNGSPVVEGMPIPGYMTNYGMIRFEPSLFLQRTRNDRPFLAANEDTRLRVADAASPATPAAPTMAAATDTTTNLPVATSYYYVAAAVNSAGESLGVVSAAALATHATTRQKITVTITRVTGATHYRLYRTNGGATAGDINGVNARWIADIPQPVSGDATFDDKNQIIPGTGKIVLIRPNVEDIAIPQMSPLIKYPIAVTTTMIEFFLLLYHTLIVKAPERHFVIKNIGTLIP